MKIKGCPLFCAHTSFEPSIPFRRGVLGPHCLCGPESDSERKKQIKNNNRNKKKKKTKKNKKKANKKHEQKGLI